MDHAYIEEHNLIDRYYQGRLPPEEEISFEEHFVGCPGCLQQLEVARSFRRGLKNMAAEDLARLETTVQIGIFAWLTRLSRGRQAGLALTAILVTVALPILWFGGELRELRHDVEQARSTVAIAQERHAAERRTVAELEERLTVDASIHAVEKERLEIELAKAQRAGSTAARQPPVEPWINVPVFLLRKLRSDETTRRVDLSRVDSPLSLAIDVGNDPAIISYRAVLESAEDGPRWRREGLEPNALEVLLITFPKGFLKPGDYRLELTGVRTDGTEVELGGYPFRVEK